MLSARMLEFYEVLVHMSMMVVLFFLAGGSPRDRPNRAYRSTYTIHAADLKFNAGSFPWPLNLDNMHNIAMSLKDKTTSSGRRP